MDEALEFKNTCKIETSENVLLKIQLLCESALISENKIRLFSRKMGLGSFARFMVLHKSRQKVRHWYMAVTLPKCSKDLEVQ